VRHVLPGLIAPGDFVSIQNFLYPTKKMGEENGLDPSKSLSPHAGEVPNWLVPIDVPPSIADREVGTLTPEILSLK